MMEEDTKELKDYLDAFRRRRASIFLVAGVLFFVTLVGAMVWPSTYQSKATILIEGQEVPTELIRSTITSFATQRIEVISQRVMSRPNLMQIVEKYNLYPSKRAHETTEEIHERMRKDIKLDMVTAEVMDPRSGHPMPTTIAFSVAYEGEIPETTQKVANELASLYLSENLKNRTEKSAETTTFLTSEAEKLGQHISELEAKLATFKRKNADTMPELSGYNFQLIERTERDITENESQLRVLQERKFHLEGELAQLNPMTPMLGDNGDRVLDPESRLKMLRSDYLSALSRYSPDHPDVVRLKREIDGLEKETGSVDSSSEEAKELSKQRSELAAARQKYSENHPDVVRLTKSVADLEQALKKHPAPPEKPFVEAKPENPAYITIKSQLEGVKSEIAAVIAKSADLKAKQADFEKRLAQTPEVERVYLDMKRDYDNSVKRYQETKSKEMEAEIGQQLEKERKGERFSLIEPPALPEKPVRPNRPAIVILGFILSMAGGLGYAFVAESVDSSVRNVRSVTALLSAPPLSVIPYMKNSADLVQEERIKRIAIVTFVSALVIAALLVHLFWTPLDVLWFKGLRKVDTVIGN